jgi:hypothetical protein
VTRGAVVAMGGYVDGEFVVKAGGGAGTMTVALSGTGVVPTYAIAPTSLAFGSQPRKTSSPPQAVTLSNTGAVDLPISSISLVGANAGHYQQSNGCVSPITIGGSCTISVVFRPTSAGSKPATLRVTPGGGAATTNVALTGTGT